MLINFFLKSTPLHNQRQMLIDFADKVGGNCVKSEDYQECDIAVIFGSWKKEPKKKWKLMLQHHFTKNSIVKNHKGKPLIVIETPLLGRTITDNHEYHRVGLNHFMRGLGDFKNENSPSDRFEKLGLEIKPWRKKGNHILIVGQNMFDASLFGIDFEWWVKNTIQHLRRHTDRPIVFRDHPENKDQMKNLIDTYKWCNVSYSNEGTINDDLKNAHCTVAYTSGSSIDSILAGVPVIPCNECNFVWSISSHQLSEIENPKLGEREQLLYDLAYAQWSVEEIKQGKPWHHLISK